jgi:GTPase
MGVVANQEINLGRTDGRTRLEPEKQDGPCEYKLHLLLRARRHFTSMSTSNSSAAFQRNGNTSSASISTGRSMSETILHRSTYQPSQQTRQARLQQLTTQLLWRLQQSSPFHSSSNAELVLPVLPEATPRLGVPERPGKLLPGLEESQGALYEIGVADDGTLVGLSDDELDESLNNLRAMAASLGCVVEILRRVSVGTCEWTEPAGAEEDNVGASQCRGQLSVAEVLVRPDSRGNSVEVGALGSHLAQASLIERTEPARGSASHLRVALAGPSVVGKSSLLGILTTSVLDNSRGRSRLSLLKHRHEIASGITSSVAHELIGYKTGAGSEDFVVNYASGDVSTWTDIHGLADRMCFMSDSPGLSKFAKSTFRALVSWKPDWTLVCASAEEEEAGGLHQMPELGGGFLPGNADIAPPTLAHLHLCLRLDLPLVVVITKMDLATKTGLRNVLSVILSVLKSVGRKPMLLSAASTPMPAFALDAAETLAETQRLRSEELAEIERTISMLRDDDRSVPIVLTSAVSGSGVGKLHALLSQLPGTRDRNVPDSANGDGGTRPIFHIDEVFGKPPVRIYSAEQSDSDVSPSGIVLCGRLASGNIRVGDELRIGPFMADEHNVYTSFPRSKSFSSQDLRRSSSIATPSIGILRHEATTALNGTLKASFLSAKVVSLRNLRLPMSQLNSGDTGTIGVEACKTEGEDLSIQRARKGMILAHYSGNLKAYRSFAATFPAKDFLVASPPLLLGGHALAYVNSVRAAVKIVALALVENESVDQSSPEVFAFDGDLQETDELAGREVRITSKFVTSVEYMETGDQVLLVPTLSAAGPVTGSVVGSNGLTGFVGSVCELTQ